MSAHRRPKRLLPLAAVLGLMATAAYGGYAVANSGHTPAASGLAETVNLAGAQGSASGHTVTIYACLAGGNLSHISAATAPKCPVRSVPVRWTGQSSPSSPAHAAPSSAPSSSASPSKAPTAPASSAPASGAPASSMPASSAPADPPSSPAAQGKACVTSALNGTCGPYSYPGISGSNGSQTNVIQDVWNPIKGASQTLTASSPGSWSVSANMPAGNTAVVSYPDTQQIYTTTKNTPNPLSGYASITSSYAGNSPAGAHDDYEAAYDIWAGTGSNNYAQEIMIWVDNHGQTPAGSAVASATIDGVGYKIWSTSKAGAVGNTVSMVLNSNQPSGSVNVLDDLKWLESNGYMPAGSGLNQIDFGWEICSTGGVPETFALSQYGIKATCTSGSACTN
jgi:glycosyl hydrolase family 12